MIQHVRSFLRKFFCDVSPGEGDGRSSEQAEQEVEYDDEEEEEVVVMMMVVEEEEEEGRKECLRVTC